jgi:hypothetical protein
MSKEITASLIVPVPTLMYFTLSHLTTHSEKYNAKYLINFIFSDIFFFKFV